MGKACVSEPSPHESREKGQAMFTAFLIKYAEIGIKGKNRYLFEDMLVHQMKLALKKCEGQFLIHKSQGRIFVEARGEFDFEEAVEIHRICEATATPEKEGANLSENTVIRQLEQ